MKKIVLFFILSLFLLGGCQLSLTNDNKTSAFKEELIASRVYENTMDLAGSVAPAIVGILANSRNGQGVGSGVCVRDGGIIITNSHVVNGADSVEVYLHNGDKVYAEVLWEDIAQDLAIIKTDIKIPFLPLTNDNSLSVGEDIVAVGTPLSLILKHSFTKGIVSALNRTLKVDTASGESYMQNLIQHDASLNPGNSGGPLINLRGEVVGINTLKISGGEGIGFAIPSKTFSSLIDSISNNNNYETPYLGVFGYDAEIAHFNSLSDEYEGYYVVDIDAKSPLNNAGLPEGCTIKKFNNVVIRNSADLRNALYGCEYGDVVKIGYTKNNQNKTAEVKLSKNNLR